MIYASFTQVFFVKELNDFRALMDICTSSLNRMTPAEARMVRRFILSKNLGRNEVFINMNDGVAVVLRADPEVAASAKAQRGYNRNFPGWKKGLWKDAYETSDGLWYSALPSDFYGDDVEHVELTETREGLFVCKINDYHFFTA